MGVGVVRPGMGGRDHLAHGWVGIGLQTVQRLLDAGLLTGDEFQGLSGMAPNARVWILEQFQERRHGSAGGGRVASQGLGGFLAGGQGTSLGGGQQEARRFVADAPQSIGCGGTDGSVGMTEGLDKERRCFCSGTAHLAKGVNGRVMVRLVGGEQDLHAHSDGAGRGNAAQGSGRGPSFCG